MKMRNKKGNVYLGIGMGFFIFIFGVLFLPFILDDIDTSRAAMSCALPDSISNGAKLFCLAIDGLVPYYIWFFVSIFFGYILGSER